MAECLTGELNETLAVRLEPVVSRIEALLQYRPHVAVALEGPAAAGKSCAADWLAVHCGARLIHMDDFFLPPELRGPSRFAEPGGNVHYERFREQVVPALCDGTALHYPAFDCSEMSFGSERCLPAAPLTVVEGVYSMHPAYGSPYDLTVFLTVEPEKQRERILKRNGPELLERYLSSWIPLELKYFESYRPQERADIILCL